MSRQSRTTFWKEAHLSFSFSDKRNLDVEHLAPKEKQNCDVDVGSSLALVCHVLEDNFASGRHILI